MNNREIEIKYSIENWKLDTLSKQEDTELVRTSLALYLASEAHKQNKLMRLKKASAIREVVYNLIAIDTKKSIEFHKQEKAKASDTIKDILASKKARFIFSAMYKKVFDTQAKTK